MSGENQIQLGWCKTNNMFLYYILVFIPWYERPACLVFGEQMCQTTAHTAGLGHPCALARLNTSFLLSDVRAILSFTLHGGATFPPHWFACKCVSECADASASPQTRETISLSVSPQTDGANPREASTRTLLASSILASRNGRRFGSVH